MSKRKSPLPPKKVAESLAALYGGQLAPYGECYCESSTHHHPSTHLLLYHKCEESIVYCGCETVAKEDATNPHTKIIWKPCPSKKP